MPAQPSCIAAGRLTQLSLLGVSLQQATSAQRPVMPAAES